jgi:L-amino acid N-acyltransferase YncA
MEIRPPRPEESEAVHALRLLGLRETSEAYGTSYEEDLQVPHEEVLTRYLPRDQYVTLCAFEDGRPVGMVGISFNRRQKTRHVANVSSMYVEPGSRRKGTARRLLGALIELARKREGVEQLTLLVMTVCEPAVALYRSLGFEQFGLEPDAMKQDGRYYDAAFMKLYLDRSPSGLEQP